MGADPVSAALISGGGELAGQGLGVLTDQIKDRSADKPQPIVANPAYQELMNRYLGIIDAYMQKKGIKPYVATGAAPAAAPAPTGAALAPVGMSAPKIDPMAAFGGRGVAGSALPVAGMSVAPIQVDNPGLDEKLTDASLAASLGAKRLGITQDAPRLPTARGQFEMDQAQKQAQLNDVYNYIYGQRRMGA